VASVMENIEKKQYDRVNLALGLFVLLFSFIIYLITVQRTLSFWDCGEFIACSYILGVPHPPGNPLFCLIGRIFSILPIAADIGFRVNLLSVVSSAFAAMFGYFVVVKLIKEWYGGRLDTMQRLGAYTGGLIGSLLMAFSLTNWNSAVEAEVYGLSMFLITFLIWLILVWSDKRMEPGANKYLILIAYLSSLSIGIHLATYLIVPLIFILIFLVDKELLKNWAFWLTCVVLMSPLLSIVLFMYLAIGWLIITGAIYFLSNNRQKYALPFFMILASFAAFSVHTYIPIRAAQRPAINENAPSNWPAFKGFLDRKQYGQKSMAERMFVRRGTWGNQFGTHPRMGFWGFFWDQYGITGKVFIWTLFPLGLIGLGELVHRRWKKGVPFFLIVLAATVGLVLYMNFADGTMQGQLGADDAHLEVRDRDYFWQSGFILYALAIGIGFTAIWDLVYGALRRRGSIAKATAVLLVGLVLPVIALSKNYFEIDRSENFIPYDYAYNLLISADSNAVVFTNGDNDTFPVWCLQEVYGIRTDVRIANLSLLNTNWYIKQLKNDMGVPISFSDAQIDQLRHYRTSEGKLMRIQDIMIDNIIETNRWNVPVMFAVTVSDNNRSYKGQRVDDHLELSGMMYRLVKESGNDMIDAEKTTKLYIDEFKYRGVADSTISKDENSSRLTNNYAAGFVYAAEMMRKDGKTDEAVGLMKKAIEVVPGAWQNYAFLAQLYVNLDSIQALDEMLHQASSSVDLSQVRMSLANTYWGRQKKSEAYEILNEGLATNPNAKNTYSQLLSYYYRDKEYDSLEALLVRWIGANPDDAEAREALVEVRKFIKQEAGSTSVNVKQLDVPAASDSQKSTDTSR